jgi:hypothetical protein
MKLFKISTIALVMALTGWVACGNDTGGGQTDAIPNINSTGGTVGRDGPAGTGGSIGAPDAGIDATHPDAPAATGPDTPIVPDVPIGVDAGPVAMDAPVTIDAPAAVDGPGAEHGPPIDTAAGEVGVVADICAALTAAQCHDSIINAAADPSVTALTPGANPSVPYPTCSAQ